MTLKRINCRNYSKRYRKFSEDAQHINQFKMHRKLALDQKASS